MNIFFGRVASVEWCDEHDLCKSIGSKDSNQGTINVRRIADEEEHYEVSIKKYKHKSRSLCFTEHSEEKTRRMATASLRFTSTTTKMLQRIK